MNIRKKYIFLLSQLIHELGLQKISRERQKKYFNAIIQCQVLSDIFHRYHIHGDIINNFPIYGDTYEYLYKAFGMNTDYISDKFRRNILKPLSEYLACTHKGYCNLAINSSDPSRYSLTQKSINMLKSYENQGWKYVELPLNKIAHTEKNVFVTIKENKMAKDIRHYEENPRNCKIYHTSILNYNALKNITKTGNETHRLVAQNILSYMPDNSGLFTQYYFQSPTGRFYQHGYNMQMLSKELRERVLTDYTCIDMKACVYFIMYNLANKFEYQGDMDYLSQMINNPDGYRQNVFEKLQEYDSDVEYSYVKNMFTAMAYGARCYEKVIANDMKHHKVDSAIMTSGYTKKDTPIEFSKIEEVSGIQSEIYKLGTFIVNECTHEDRLVNAAGMLMNKKEANRGEKIAFIVQGVESMLLQTILDIPVELNLPLKCAPFAIGLLLHDGLYVRKKYAFANTGCLNTSGGTCLLSQYLFERTGFSMKF